MVRKAAERRRDGRTVKSGQNNKRDRYFSDSSAVNLCCKCETVLKGGNFFVRKLTIGPDKAFCRCDFCQRITYCAEFEVSKQKTSKRTDKTASE